MEKGRKLISATRAGHSYIGTEHILLGLLREGEGIAARVLETMGAEPSKIRNQVCLAVCMCLSPHAVCRPAVRRLLHYKLRMQNMGFAVHAPQVLCMLSLWMSAVPCPCALPPRRLLACRQSVQVIRMIGESQEPVGASVGGGSGSNKTPTLEEYGTNLTQQAEEVCAAVQHAALQHLPVLHALLGLPPCVCTTISTGQAAPVEIDAASVTAARAWGIPICEWAAHRCSTSTMSSERTGAALHAGQAGPRGGPRERD